MSGAIEQKLTAMLAAARAERSFLYLPSGGLADCALRRVAAGALMRPLPGVYAAPGDWSALAPNDRARYAMRALARRDPGIQFCSYSAALLSNLEVHYSRAFPLQVAANAGSHRRQYQNLRYVPLLHRARYTVDGLCVTSIEDTLFECLRSDGLKYALGPLDSALRLGLVEKEALVEHFRLHHRGQKGVRRAIAAAKLGDSRAANGGESYARAVMYELGFEMPELQVPIENPLDPGRFFYADFGWRRDGRLVALGELDGVEKYLSPYMTGGMQPFEVMRRERMRESLITLAACPVVRFTFGALDNPRGMTELLDAYGVPHRRDT